MELADSDATSNPADFLTGMMTLSPLHLSINESDLARTTELLDGGADIEETDPLGQTPLIAAAANSSKMKLGLNSLFSEGLDLNRNKIEEFESVMKADSQAVNPTGGAIEMVRLLL